MVWEKILFTGSFIKIWYQQPCQDFSCPPCLFLDSRRTWIFLIDLEMVSDGREHPSEVSVKVLSRSDIRNHVKTPPVLQVSSWSLGGYGYSWWTMKDFTCPQSLWRAWTFLMELEMVSDGRELKLEVTGHFKRCCSFPNWMVASEMTCQF